MRFPLIYRSLHLVYCASDPLICLVLNTYSSGLAATFADIYLGEKAETRHILTNLLVSKQAL